MQEKDKRRAQEFLTKFANIRRAQTPVPTGVFKVPARILSFLIATMGFLAVTTFEGMQPDYKAAGVAAFAASYFVPGFLDDLRGMLRHIPLTSSSSHSRLQPHQV